MSTIAPSSLPSPDDLMASLRTTLPQFRQIEWFERISSTNADLMTKTRTSQLRLDRPWLLGAHLKEKGRGRAGRTWQNRAGANPMLSCAFDLFLTRSEERREGKECVRTGSSRW